MYVCTCRRPARWQARSIDKGSFPSLPRPTQSDKVQLQVQVQVQKSKLPCSVAILSPPLLLLLLLPLSPPLATSSFPPRTLSSALVSLLISPCTPFHSFCNLSLPLRSYVNRVALFNSRQSSKRNGFGLPTRGCDPNPHLPLTSPSSSTPSVFRCIRDFTCAPSQLTSLLCSFCLMRATGSKLGKPCLTCSFATVKTETF